MKHYLLMPLVALCLFPLSLNAQNTTEQSPDTLEIGMMDVDFTSEKVPNDGEVPHPNAFVLHEREPRPTNMDEVRRSIGYPAAAKKEGIEGKVMVRVLIDEKGNYMRHVVIREGNPVLLEAVEKGIVDLKFEPAILAGHPVKAWTTIPFNFQLSLPKDGKKKR